MKKLILIVLVFIFVLGCSNTKEKIEEPIVSEESTISDEPTNEVVEEEVSSYAVINALENEENLYLRFVFMIDKSYEYINVDDNVIYDLVVQAQDTNFSDGDLVDVYAKNYKDKIVFYKDIIIENQDIDELSNKIKETTFDIGLGEEKIIEHNIETVYVNNEPLVYKEYEPDFSYDILGYEVKDDKRYYSLPYKFDFVSFSMPNDVDESVYVALTPSLKEDSEEAYLCVYVPFTSKLAANGPSEFYPGYDQAAECYIIDKGINAASTCCATGRYDSYPIKDYDNGYRISSAMASLDMILMSEEDINIYKDVSSRYPIIMFE